MIKSPFTPPIKVDKTYYTVDGREARIYSTDGGGTCPVHGAVKYDDIWKRQRWKFDGTSCLTSNHKIVAEEWEPSDKELVWAYNENQRFSRKLVFFDAKGNWTFDEKTGKRGSVGYDYYEPYEGVWPEWAHEAYRRLED